MTDGLFSSPASPTSSATSRDAFSPGAGPRHEVGGSRRGVLRFPLAVKGFFDNGGQRLYVKRVVASGAITATAALKQGLFLDLRKASKKGDKVIELSRVSNLIGMGVGTEVHLVRMDGAPPQGPFTVASYDAASGDITLGQGTQRRHRAWLLGRAGPRVRRHPGLADLHGRLPGEWGNKLRVRLRPMASSTLRLLAAPESAGGSSHDLEAHGRHRQGRQAHHPGDPRELQ